MQRAADRACHRDMARNHQVERQAGDLEFDQRRIDCVARADQRADQIVGRLAFAAPDRVDEIVLQGDGAARMHKPLFHEPSCCTKIQSLSQTCSCAFAVTVTTWSEAPHTS